MQIGSQDGKYKLGARVGKHKLEARAGGRGWGPRSGPGAKKRAEDREIQTHWLSVVIIKSSNTIML